MVNKGPGRPVGGSTARERLITAATTQFLAAGYSDTTVRSIAAEAGVHHALVKYHFGNKEGLFRVVMDLVVSPAHVVEQVAATHSTAFAPALLNAALTAWDIPEVRSRIVSLITDLESDHGGHAVFRDYIQTQVIARVSGVIGGRDARQRAGAVSALLVGVFVTRYVLELNPIASMSRRELVRHLTPSLQACLGTSGRQLK